MFDLVLRGGTVVDGTGAPGRTADVAVAEGRIVGVGRLTGASARHAIDVDGAVVAPGFIDLHSHSDFTIPSAPGAVTQATQGVTTLVTGNCGFSPFPVVPEHADELRAVCDFLDDGLDWTWRSAEEYARAIEALPLGVNLALQVGHDALRIGAMGAGDRRPAAAELATMQRLLDESAPHVVGFSTGLVYA
ncbi:MAG TPA: amidohydrolase family protein, partial [Actinopolymorphaceae bacterium]